MFESLFRFRSFRAKYIVKYLGAAALKSWHQTYMQQLKSMHGMKCACALADCVPLMIRNPSPSWLKNLLVKSANSVKYF